MSSSRTCIPKEHGQRARIWNGETTKQASHVWIGFKLSQPCYTCSFDVPLPQFSTARGNFFSLLKKAAARPHPHVSSPWIIFSFKPRRQERPNDESLMEIIRQSVWSVLLWLVVMKKSRITWKDTIKLDHRGLVWAAARNVRFYCWIIWLTMVAIKLSVEKSSPKITRRVESFRGFQIVQDWRWKR